MPEDPTDDWPTLVQVMAWCCQATSHYLNQCWNRMVALGHNELKHLLYPSLVVKYVFQLSTTRVTAIGDRSRLIIAAAHNTHTIYQKYKKISTMKKYEIISRSSHFRIFLTTLRSIMVLDFPWWVSVWKFHQTSKIWWGRTTRRQDGIRPVGCCYEEWSCDHLEESVATGKQVGLVN